MTDPAAAAGVKPRRLILWDVDGTLLHAGGIAGDVFYDAAAVVVGREISERNVRMGGKTDPQIALEILEAMAVRHDEAAGHLPAVLEALERQLEAAVDEIREKGRVHPGVPELLERLAATPDVVSSVLTGNLAKNARLKLGAFDLERWFDMEVAAFGSDDADRTKLVPIALANLERRFGVTLPAEDVWVVGDTPRDLACARAADARCLLVATGRVPLEELERVGPDVALPDLSDTERVFELLTG